MKGINLLRYMRHEARILAKYARRPRRYRQILQTVEKLQPKSILEVGVYQGKRGVEMIEAAMLSRAADEIAYFGFDLFEQMTTDILRDELSKWPNAMAEVTERLKRTGVSVELRAGFTQQTLPIFIAANPRRTIDFIFIDGGHAVDTIRSDWSNLSRLMHSNSVVLFDDYYVDCPHLTEEFGCNKVVEDLDENLFDWRVLDDVDYFQHDGKPHNVAMVEVTRREPARAI